MNDDVQTWFEKKKHAYRISNPDAERVNAKSQYILHRKWTLTCILCTRQKSDKLDKGIMLIFVSEKNRPLLLAKGVYVVTPGFFYNPSISNICYWSYISLPGYLSAWCGKMN